METVKIGNQEWSTVNLNVDKFNNGDPIPEIQNMEDWNQASKNKQPAFCYYDNNSENRPPGPWGKLGTGKPWYEYPYILHNIEYFKMR